MRSRLFVSLLAVAGLLLAACGGSSGSSGSGADPAKLAPASAPIYVEAALRPGGQLGDDAKAALKKLLRTDDPGAKLVDLVNRAGRRHGVSWDDVKPWLGERVGLFIGSLQGGKPVGAAIVQVTDADKAKAAIVKLFGRDAKLSDRDYKGVKFSYDAGKDAAVGIVDGFAVVGKWDGVRQAVDTSKGAAPLSGVADFTSARSAVKADQDLGFGYVQVKAIGELVSSMGSSLPGRSAAAMGAVQQLLAKAGRALTFGLHADGAGIRIDAATLGAPASSLAGAQAGAERLAELPGDAWLALGLGDIGASLSRSLAQLDQLSAAGGGAGIGQVLGQLRARTGIDVQRDLLSWMGDGAVYARGTGLADLGAVLTVTSKDPARSVRAVTLIGRALARQGASVSTTTVEGYERAIAIKLGSLPFPLLVAAGGDRFSLGVNRQALADVLRPSSKLGDSSQYAAATKALGAGVRPLFLLDTPTVVGLIESFAGQRPELQKAKPYLEALGPLAAGGAHEGDVTRFALALGLR